ncbi:MAG: SiaB family protein kinase [Bacteroidales bacterium]|nr:SiaB family protein kinase [Bacteroidales bacterium]
MAKSEEKNKELSFFYDYFQRIKDTELTYIYRGNFTQSIIKQILALTETNIEHTEESTRVKKRIYLIMVEGLQNITRHQDFVLETEETTAVFFMQKKGDLYFITTGNLIPNDKIENLEEQIKKVNSLEGDELKKYYREVLTHGRISEKGGAGLGLIEMARKSGSKLKYKFNKLNDSDSFFYLQTGINIDKTKEIPSLEKAYSLEALDETNRILAEKRILLNFNGLFTQDSLLGLLSIIESQMAKVKNVYNIIVELLQNIVRHGASINNAIEGKEGMFLIQVESNAYFLTSGNYIENKDVKELSEYIDYINEIDEAKLEEFHNNKLLEFNEDDIYESGLGLAEMKMKTKQNLVTSFYPVDDNFSFFTIRATVLYGE